MTHDADGAALLAHLRTHVHGYYDGVTPDQLRVELLTTSRHHFSKTYRFRITGADIEQLVFAKMMCVSSRGSVALGHDRPRLAPMNDWVNMRPRSEYRSLCAASERFQRIGDPHLGAVRPLDYIAERRAIVMEVIEEPTLRQLLWKATRIAGPIKGSDLDIVFRHAGAWLREFHQVSVDGDDVSALRERRADVLEAFTEYGEFLAERLAAKEAFRDVVSTALSCAPSVLPDVLPLGVGHGDFAPRNIFVSPKARVTVIDMIGRWRVPIYEDLAYFVTELRAAAPQRLTYGLALHPDRLARYESELLAGYFDGKAIPHGAIAFFELLLLLDRWSAVVRKAGGGPTVRRARELATQAITNRYLLREARGLARAVAEAGT